ncbi:hypothetical protein HYH03_016451 [Edaphochlamys debaryana]|uniref:Uncharacterized protein n=1 Tax=Edaphochlamys debaryana TaxID=47281 RepID=A0A836BRM9_9CHLO|nr:hypothetical protein HYH03_016451 [Edaphochlamys debaryana]|eukprot:KAG2484798.1 hypothetical protein HYH03_016451 [Edaphochlamys debaryana]
MAPTVRFRGVERKCVSYVPWATLFSFLLVLIGTICWGVGASNALDASRRAMDSLYIDLGLYIRTVKSACVASVVCCGALALTMAVMGCVRARTRRRVDRKGRPYKGQLFWYTASAALTALWWLVLFTLMFVVLGSAVWYGMTAAGAGVLKLSVRTVDKAIAGASKYRNTTNDLVNGVAQISAALSQPSPPPSPPFPPGADPLSQLLSSLVKPEAAGEGQRPPPSAGAGAAGPPPQQQPTTGSAPGGRRRALRQAAGGPASPLPSGSSGPEAGVPPTTNTSGAPNTSPAPATAQPPPSPNPPPPAPPVGGAPTPAPLLPPPPLPLASPMLLQPPLPPPARPSYLAFLNDSVNGASCPDSCLSLDLLEYVLGSSICVCNATRLHAALDATLQAQGSLGSVLAGCLLLWAGASFLLMMSAADFAEAKRERVLLQLMLRASDSDGPDADKPHPNDPDNPFGQLSASGHLSRFNGAGAGAGAGAAAAMGASYVPGEDDDIPLLQQKQLQAFQDQLAGAGSKDGAGQQAPGSAVTTPLQPPHPRFAAQQQQQQHFQQRQVQQQQPYYYPQQQEQPSSHQQMVEVQMQQHLRIQQHMERMPLIAQQAVHGQMAQQGQQQESQQEGQQGRPDGALGQQQQPVPTWFSGAGPRVG